MHIGDVASIKKKSWSKKERKKSETNPCDILPVTYTHTVRSKSQTDIRIHLDAVWAKSNRMTT